MAAVAPLPSMIASTRPGKPAPEPRSSPALRRRRRQREQLGAESAKWRDQMSSRVLGATRLMVFCHCRSSARKPLEVVQSFHVKHRNGSAKPLGGQRLGGREAPSGRLPRGARVLTWASSSMSAAGVMPSMRAAWAKRRRAMALELLAHFGGEPGERRIVETRPGCAEPRPCARLRRPPPGGRRRRRSGRRPRPVRRWPGCDGADLRPDAGQARRNRSPG